MSDGSKPGNYGPLLGLNAVSIIWGATFPLGKFVVATLPPFIYLSYRYVIAVVILFFISRSALRRATRQQALTAFLVGLALFCSMIFQSVAVQYTSAAKTSFAFGAYVVFVPMLSFLLFRTRLTARIMAASLMGVAGLALIGGGEASFFEWDFGVFLTIVAAFFAALQIIGVGRFAASIDAGMLSFYQSAAVTICCLIAAPLTETHPEQVPMSVYMAVLFLSVMATVAANIIQCRTQKHLNHSVAAIIISMSSLYGALLSWLFLDEPLTGRMLIGGGLLFAALLVTQLGGSSAKASA
ncbi:hypothetical protein C4J81_14295 [Deltaproteobacteria bacterium Smac51]|nr:hypothetical protein C4J81_14295 [Deltaproteobacteria bacterium Smac51]